VADRRRASATGSVPAQESIVFTTRITGYAWPLRNEPVSALKVPGRPQGGTGEVISSLTKQAASGEGFSPREGGKAHASRSSARGNFSRAGGRAWIGVDQQRLIYIRQGSAKFLATNPTYGNARPARHVLSVAELACGCHGPNAPDFFLSVSRGPLGGSLCSV
jgi:hypothetical protein